MVEYDYPGPVDRAFGALAHPTRRAIVTELARRSPARVTDLAVPFDVSLNAVSKHLKILERSGLVKREVVGREHWCRLELSAVAPALDWLDRQRRFWTESLELLEVYIESRERESHDKERR